MKYSFLFGEGIETTTTKKLSFVAFGYPNDSNEIVLFPVSSINNNSQVPFKIIKIKY